jgi:RNA polymerase sigma-70 factor, ECF subfamily
MKKEDKIKFEKIYGDESDSIFRFCLVRLPDKEHALDITQETFMRLWQCTLDKKEITNIRAFLFTVAHNLIIDWYRKKKSFSLEKIFSRTDHEYILPQAMISESPEVGAEGRYILEKINELAPAHQHAVYLRLVEDLSPVEIGDILGISSNAASVRVSRGLVELRQKAGLSP